MDGSLWTEVRGRKSDGRKFVDGSPMDESPWTEVYGWKFVDRSPTDVRRTSDESWTEVRRKFLDGSSTYVERVELSRRCDDGGWRRYTATLRNAVTMAGNAVVCNVVATLAGNALQFATFLRRYCSNALDLATLL